MDNPLISVIVPIYKVEPYLRRCLDSIVNQTYTNLEIILVDDGSPDACPTICDEYAAKDNRIVVIHKENGGLSDARNAGLDICKGEYITFVDSDDWISENCLSLFINVIQKDYFDVVIADYQETNKEKQQHILASETSLFNNDEIANSYMHSQYPPCAWNKLYNAAFLKKIKIKFKKNLLYEDQLWCCDWTFKANKIHFLKYFTYFYRIRENSIMNSSSITINERNESWVFIINTIFKTNHKRFSSNRLFFLFLENKVQEFLFPYLNDVVKFHKAYDMLEHELGFNPIYFWLKTASILKKLFFVILLILPDSISKLLLHKHLKNKPY